jgi:hypothetical protein
LPVSAKVLADQRPNAGKFPAPPKERWSSFTQWTEREAAMRVKVAA